MENNAGFMSESLNVLQMDFLYVVSCPKWRYGLNACISWLIYFIVYLDSWKEGNLGRIQSHWSASEVLITHVISHDSLSKAFSWPRHCISLTYWSLNR